MAAAKKAAKKEQNPLVLVQREIGLRGTLHDFVKLAWNQVEPAIDFFDNWHIGAICEHLQAVEDGQIGRLIINVPPGCMKSRLTGVFWPVWAWIRDPALRFGYFSFDGELTLKQSRDSLALVQSDWFQERWGSLIKLVERDPAAGSYYNTQGGWRFASSLEGKATGHHFHRQVIDDPLKPRAISKVTLDAARNWLSGTMATRWVHGSKHLARVIVMQRLHEDDTTGVALAQGGYEHLMLPMYYEKKRACSTSIGFNDPRKEEGELLWPDFQTPAVIAEVVKDLTVQERAAQLQQNPVPAGGNIFRSEWFRTWVRPGASTEHLKTMDPPRIFKALPDKMDVMWQSWDFTFKDTSTSDFVVGQVWGRKRGDFFLLYQTRDRMAFSASLAAMRRVTTMFPKSRAKLVEDKANGSAIIDTLQDEISGIIAVTPEGGKESRAQAVSPMHEAGNVYYPDESMAGYDWVTHHRDEMAAFPFAKNDDTVDCESQALLWGSSGMKQFNEAMARLQGQGPEARQLRDLLARFGR